MAQYQRVGVLDTNMLHFVGLYLGFAKENALFPWQGNDTEDVAAALARLDGLGEVHSAKESLKRGFYVVKIALEREFSLRYGTISELELLVGRIRGKAILHAADEGVPDRMWSKFLEREIRDRVRDAAMTETAGGVDEIGQWLDELGLADRTTSRKELADAIGLAREIVRSIFMDVADSIVYASALLTGAEVLFTTDKFLRNTVNRVQNPSEGGNAVEVERFRTIHQRLQGYVATEPSGKPVFPRAHTVGPSGKVDPRFL